MEQTGRSSENILWKEDIVETMMGCVVIGLYSIFKVVAGTLKQRQEWYRDFVRSIGEKPLPFVGSADSKNNIEKVAGEIRHAL